MHFQDLVIILGFNLIVILVFFTIQKKAIAKNIKHLKNEIQELEDLVAAIIEEFEEIAQRPENGTETESEYRKYREENLDLKLNISSPDTVAAGLEHDDEYHPQNTPFAARQLNEGFQLSAAALEEMVGSFHNGETVEKEVGENEEYTNDNWAADNNVTEYSLGDGYGLFKSVPDYTRQTDEKTETVVHSEFINDPKHRRIYELWKQGLTIEEIARQLSTGRGEIQLIVGIYKRG